MKPEIILFDEPTSALDPTMVGEVQAVIRDLAEQGLTMMVVTHDMAFSKEIANRIFYMDEGIVYEDGTPEQIFNNPQREKTRAFVKRLRAVEYQINSADFDLYQLNALIEEFGRKHYLAGKTVKNIELMIEEMVIHSLLPYTQNILVQAGYFEVDNKIEVSFEYDKESYDPFHAEKEDALSMLLVRQMTENIRHYYDDRNHLVMELSVKE